MPGDEYAPSRRTVLQNTGLMTAVAAGLAGCLGGDQDEDSDGGDGGNGGNGGDGSDGGGDETATPGSQFPEFDPNNPEYPQPGDLLLEHNFHRGTKEFLDSIREREIPDEPFYGDDVPETPKDESELLDPDEIVVTIGSGEARPAEYKDALEPLMNNLEKETGRPVTFKQVNSVTSKIEAMRSDRIHVANFGTGEIPFAVNIAGANPFAMPTTKLEDGGLLFGYAGWLITQIDNEEINSVPDLEGQGLSDDRPRPVAHAAKDSNSGNQAPTALFAQRFDVVPGEDYERVFSGSHENSIRGVSIGDYAAAPDAATDVWRLHEADQVDAGELKCCWREVFPSGPNCMNHKLTPELQEAVKRAHYDYDYGDTDITRHAIDGGNFVEMEYKRMFHTILQIHAFLEYEYSQE